VWLTSLKTGALERFDEVLTQWFQALPDRQSLQCSKWNYQNVNAGIYGVWVTR
jgi:hypothetical protein